MYIVKKPFDSTAKCLAKFNTLKSASLYCDKTITCEDLQICKIDKKRKIVDIYELTYCSIIVTAISCATGRVYTYFKD